VIYLDSSVVLAQIFAEDRSLPSSVAGQALISSRLLEYEVWNRVHARGFTHSHSEEVAAIFARLPLVDLTSEVLGRALLPFPMAVRTLDSLHLATMEFLRAHGEEISLASFDRRLTTCAQALGIALYPL